MRCETGDSCQLLHCRPRDSAQIEKITPGVGLTETQDLVAEPVLLRVLTALCIAAFAHGLQKIKSGAVRNLVLDTDFLYRDAEAGVIQAVQNVKGALEGRDVIFFG